MPGTFNQILHLPSSQLNTIDMGSPGETSLDGGTGAARFLGQLGGRLVLGPNEVRFDSAIGTLHGGIYQLVRTKAASTIAPTLGFAAYWDPTDDASVDGFIVTPDDPGLLAAFAGVYISAPTKGNYCIIQVAGIVDAQFVASITETGAIGDVVVSQNTATFNNVANATAMTADLLSAFVGYAIEAPVDATITQIYLTNHRFNF